MDQQNSSLRSLKSGAMTYLCVLKLVEAAGAVIAIAAMLFGLIAGVNLLDAAIGNLGDYIAVLLRYIPFRDILESVGILILIPIALLVLILLQGLGVAKLRIRGRGTGLVKFTAGVNATLTILSIALDIFMLIYAIVNDEPDTAVIITAVFIVTAGIAFQIIAFNYQRDIMFAMDMVQQRRPISTKLSGICIFYAICMMFPGVLLLLAGFRSDGSARTVYLISAILPIVIVVKYFCISAVYKKTLAELR